MGESIRITIAATNIKVNVIRANNGTPINSNPRSVTTNNPTDKLKNKQIVDSRKPAMPFIGLLFQVTVKNGFTIRKLTNKTRIAVSVGVIGIVKSLIFPPLKFCVL